MSPTPLDLNLLPLVRQNGQDQPSIPGLFMVTPPKRTARGRDEDRLVLYFTPQGNAPMEEAQIQQILGRLSTAYYKTPGSVTLALRATADIMNVFLLERNGKFSNSGKQTIGLLALAVLREEKLTLGICGPIHAYLITPQETQEWFDQQASGRGLGLSRSVSVRFFQADLQANHYLILAPQPPSSWNPAALQNAHSMGIESFRRRLLTQAGADLTALLIQPQPGTGKVRLLRTRPPAQMVREGSQEPGKASSEKPLTRPPSGDKEEPRKKQAPVVIPLPGPQDQPLTAPKAETVTPEAVTPDDSTPAAAKLELKTEAKPVSQPAPVMQEAQTAERPAKAAKTKASPKPKKQLSAPKLPSISLGPVGKGLAWVGRGLAAAAVAVSHFLVGMLKKILPDETLLNIPTTTMAVVAIGMAVVISTAGVAVYNERGRMMTYQKYYDLALQEAAQALQQDDPAELRIRWETVLDYLDKADDFKVTSELQSLQANAQASLDEMDYIRRLQYNNAIIGGFGNDVSITEMIATGADLFMLNGKAGNVFRAKLTGGGYEIDPNFECGPTPFTGPIQDIAVLPRSSSATAHVTLLGLDSNNQFVTCESGDTPKVIAAAAPQLGWVSPSDLIIDNGDLYVLDAGNRSVWIYRNLNFSDPPHLFFGDEIPNTLAGSVDMAVVGERLFLLNEDSHIIQCSYSSLSVSPTRCDDPMPYSDLRPGRSDAAIILDARFAKILYSPPPNPSLYLLDPIHQSVYHFSLQLAIQAQYRPLEPLGNSDATAFAVGPDHTVFLAVENRVYSSSLP